MTPRSGRVPVGVAVAGLTGIVTLATILTGYVDWHWTWGLVPFLATPRIEREGS